MAKRFTVETVFKMIDKVSAPVTRMQNKIGKLLRGIQTGFLKVNRTVKKFSAGLKKGLTASAVALTGFGLILKGVITKGADFGRAIGSAAAKFPDKIKRGTKEFKALEKAARDVGATTEFTATEAARGLNFLAKAGFDAKFSIDSLRDIVDFATSSEIELAQAADIASDAIGAFGLNSKDPAKKLEGLRRVMDVMSKTANSTNTTVEQLFETIKNGAPVAVKAGQTVETFAAIAGTLASVGIKGTQAGTATKNIALALAGVGNQAGKVFNELNIPLTVKGKMRDVADVFEDLTKSLKGVDEDKVLLVMNAIFGKISLASAANLLGGGAEKIRKLRKELEKAKGSSRETAKFIRNDVRGSIDSLTSAIDGVQISIFSLNDGPLKKAIDGFTDWIRKNEELIASNLGGFLLSIFENFSKIVNVLKQIGKAILIFKTFQIILAAISIATSLYTAVMVTFSLATKAVTFAFALLNKVMKVNPINLIIGILLTAASVIIGNWEPVSEFFKNLWSSITSGFKTVKTVASALGSLFGFGDNEDDAQQNNSAAKSSQRQLVSPSDRVARSIEETRTTSTAEVTIRDQTGRAEVTRGKLGAGIQLQPSGAM